MQYLNDLIATIEKIPTITYQGRVTNINGLLVECSGLSSVASIGSRCKIISRDDNIIQAEVVGFKGEQTLLMPFIDVNGVGPGCIVELSEEQAYVYPMEGWKGRIINALAEPIDDKGPLPLGKQPIALRNPPPSPHERKRVIDPIDLGVKAINSFTTCCKGQRMGIFSGSGVGKSMLMSMLTRYSETDVKIVGLIGERGREVQEFIKEYLGEEGLKNTIVVVATSNESALMRRQASYLTLSISEYFRDQGNEVLCIIDSITRFAMAQREIGLSAGEPPTTKGYTPTVFSELPKLLERAGPGAEGKGDITGLFSVLVEGDDHNEPISDTVRGIVDGHITLDRKIAERGRFPAINILRSVSRTVPQCLTEQQNQIITTAKNILSIYNDMEDMIRLGAYQKGSDEKIDQAIHYFPLLDAFVSQRPDEHINNEQAFAQLEEIVKPLL